MIPTLPYSGLVWIVVVPILGALINGLSGRFIDRARAAWVGVGAVAISFIVTCAAAFDLAAVRATQGANAALTQQLYDWFTLTIPRFGDVPVHVRLAMDGLTSVMALIVTGVGLLIHIYAATYMRDDPAYKRFFAYLNLFMASMLVLVLASNLVVMFVGWEGVGLCSYLLIGFWHRNVDYAAAARKAFVINRIGDFGFLLGTFILVTAVGSAEFFEISRVAQSGGLSGIFAVGIGAVRMSVATAACLFLFLGCAGKSAQLPLFVWLPDAMAGPTPVSALIHAATMVTAGVYLCCRLSPVFALSTPTMLLIASIGTATALIGATVALVQTEMKKILAYSTVSQLGFMFAAVGVGCFSAAAFHVYTHAFFKACLFLGAGSVMHAVGAHGDVNIMRLGGLRKALPVTHLAMLAGCAALAGLPLMSGFFSKEQILVGAVDQALGGETSAERVVGWFVTVGLSLAAFLTAVYAFRLFGLTFSGEYQTERPRRSTLPPPATSPGIHMRVDMNSHGDDAYDPYPQESPFPMVGPLALLALGAIVAGLVGVPESWVLPHAFSATWPGWIEGTVVSFVERTHSAHGIAMILGLGAALGGTAIGLFFYIRKREDVVRNALPGPVARFFEDEWRINGLYSAVIVEPLKAISVVIGHADRTFVDAIFTRLPSLTIQGLGAIFRRMENGVVQSYAGAMTVGAIGILWWALQAHPDASATVSASKVQLTARAGMGYLYRWDANDDGVFETDWTDDPQLEFAYEMRDYRGVELEVDPTHGAHVVAKLDDRWRLVSFTERLGRSGAARTQEFLARWQGEFVELRAAGARVDDGVTESRVFRVPLGPRQEVGSLALHARPLVRARVEVRNAFGHVAQDTVRVALPESSAAPVTRATNSKLAGEAR